MQYIKPASHLTLLTHIVQSDKDFSKNLKDSIACLIRIDGSVDRTQMNKIYICLKTINKDGTEKFNFIGIGKQTQPSASGLMEAVKNCICDNYGTDIYQLIMQKGSSIVTDGCSLNTGYRAGL